MSNLDNLLQTFDRGIDEISTSTGGGNNDLLRTFDISIAGGDGERFTGTRGQPEPKKKEIHESMWDDINPETGEDWTYGDALKKYEEWAERDDTKIVKGRLVQIHDDGKRPTIIPHPEESTGDFLTKQEFNFLGEMPKVMPGGFIVPTKVKSKEEIEKIEEEKAEIDPEADATVGIGQKTYDAVLDAGGEMFMTGTALTDVIFGTNYTEAQRQKWPNANSENLGDMIWVEAAPIAGAYGVGRKLIFKSVEGGTKVIQYSKKFINELMGTLMLASGTELETGGLLVGEQALIKAIEGANFGDSAAQQKLAQVVNITMDAFIASGIFNGLTYIPAAIVNVTNHGLAQPILNLFRGEKGTKTRIINALLEEASGDYSTKAEFMEAKIKMAQLIKENKDYFVELSKKDPTKNLNISLDVATSLKQQLGKDEKTDRLLMPIITKIEEKLKGLDPSGVPQAQAEIVAGTEKALDDIIETGAGDAPKVSDELAETFETASDVITTTSKTELDDALVLRQGAIDNLDELEKSILDKAKIDPEYGSKIDSLTKELSENPTQAFTKTELGGEVAISLNNAAEMLTNIKNEKFAKISGGSIDIDGLYTAISEIKDIGTFTDMTSTISSSKPLSSILKIFQKTKAKKKGQKTADPMTDEDYIDELQKVLQKNNIDFGRLHNEIRPELVALIDDAKGPIKNSLINLKRFIDYDSLQHLVEVGQGSIKANAQDAMKFFVDRFAPYFRQGEGDDLSRWYTQWEKTARVKKPEISENAGEFLKGRAYNEETMKLLENVTQSSSLKAQTFGDIADLIRTSDPASAKNLYNYIMHDVLIKAQNVISSSGGINEISKQSINDLSIGLARVGESLRKGQFIDEADQLDDFINILNQNTDNIDGAKKLIEEATNTAKLARDKMLNNELKMFWKAAKKDGLDIDVVPTSEPEQAFQQLFKSEGKILDRVNKVMAMAETNPVVLDALRSSYGKYLHNLIFGSGKTTSNTRTVKLQKIDDRAIQLETILKAGDEIFKDSVGVYGPETMQGIRELIDTVRGIELSRRGGSSGVSQTAYATMARGAVSNLTKIFLGPLTRPGARISAITSGIISKLAPDDVALRLTKDLLNNPDEFARLAKSQINWMSDETQDIMFRSFVRSGIYSDDDRKEFEDFYFALVEGAKIIDNTYRTVTNPIKQGFNVVKGLFSPQ